MGIIITILIALICYLFLCFKKESKKTTKRNTNNDLSKLNLLRYRDVSFPALNQKPKKENKVENDNVRKIYPKQSKVPYLLLNIIYFDQEWELTERDIQVFKFKSHFSEGSINAFCFLREDQRTFHISEIQQCIDLQTGELIIDVRKFICDFYDRPYVPSVPREDYSRDMALLVEFKNEHGIFEKRRLLFGKRFNQNDGLLKAWWIDNPDENDRRQTVIDLNDIAKITDLRTLKVVTDKRQFMLDFLAS
jgi:hypothetical protein